MLGGLLHLGDALVVAAAPWITAIQSNAGTPKAYEDLVTAFAYLILNRDADVERELLAEALWPDRLPADPDTALSAILSKMRKVIQPGV